jgi:hypothetical protein
LFSFQELARRMSGWLLQAVPRPPVFAILSPPATRREPLAPLLMLIFVVAALVTIVSAWQLWRAAMAPLDGG